MSGGHLWVPSTATREAGERARVSHSIPEAVADGVQLAASPALDALARVLTREVRGVTSVGRRRPSDRLAGASRDPHRLGVAGDAMIRDDGTREAVGDALAAWLVEHAETLGVQYVLWSNFEWSASRIGPRWERYTGSDPHHDHVHFELSPEGRALGAAEMERRAMAALREAGSGLAVWLMAAAVLAALAGVAWGWR